MRLQDEESAWATADSAESRAGGGAAWEILSRLPEAAPAASLPSQARLSVHRGLAAPHGHCQPSPALRFC